METTTKVIIPTDDENGMNHSDLRWNGNSPTVRVIATLILSTSAALMGATIASIFVSGWVLFAIAILSAIAGFILEAICWASSVPTCSRK